MSCSEQRCKQPLLSRFRFERENLIDAWPDMTSLPEQKKHSLTLSPNDSKRPVTLRLSTTIAIGAKAKVFHATRAIRSHRHGTILLPLTTRPPCPKLTPRKSSTGAAVCRAEMSFAQQLSTSASEQSSPKSLLCQASW